MSSKFTYIRHSRVRGEEEITREEAETCLRRAGLGGKAIGDMEADAASHGGVMIELNNDSILKILLSQIFLLYI